MISVASGKGGTGKTTVAVNLALSLPHAQILDCDVEEPNAHIFVKPKIDRRETVTIPVPKVDESKCRFCGKCQEVCAYHAVAVLKDKVLIFPELCHGCGACSYFCPQRAIREVPKEIGVVESGRSGDLLFVHGRLREGEAMSPPLIRAVKKFGDPHAIQIIDAPPGTSCPVIAAVRGSEFCVLVTEPTPFGLNDLILAVGVMKKLSLPCGVVINRSDLGDSKTEDYCRKEGIPVLMRIPFKREIAVLYSKGEPLVHARPEYRKEFKMMYEKINEMKRRPA